MIPIQPIPGRDSAGSKQSLPDGRAMELLNSQDPSIRSLAPEELVKEKGHKALPHLTRLLERDGAPEVREAGFCEIAMLLAQPPREGDRQQVDYMRRGVHTAIDALNTALLAERDTATTCRMAEAVKRLTSDNPQIGDLFTDTLIRVATRDRFHGEGAPNPLLKNPLMYGSTLAVCEALATIADNTLDKGIVRRIAAAADELMEKDGAVKGGMPGPNYEHGGARLLLIHLETKKDLMGIKD